MTQRIQETARDLTDKKKQLAEANRRQLSIDAILEQQAQAAKEFKGDNIVLSESADETLLDFFRNLLCLKNLHFLNRFFGKF